MPTEGDCMQRACITNYFINANATTPNWWQQIEDRKLERFSPSDDQVSSGGMVGFKTDVACSNANSKDKKKASKLDN